MYCSDQQIRLIRFFSLLNAKTGYGRLDTAKSLDNSLWSLSKSQRPKFQNVSERSRNMIIRSRSGVGVENFRLRTPLTPLLSLTYSGSGSGTTNKVAVAHLCPAVLNMIRFSHRDPTGFCNSEQDLVWSEISDFTPGTHAQSNILPLHTKYADKPDYLGLGIRVPASMSS